MAHRFSLGATSTPCAYRMFDLNIFERSATAGITVYGVRLWRTSLLCRFMLPFRLSRHFIDTMMFVWDLPHPAHAICFHVIASPWYIQLRRIYMCVCGSTVTWCGGARVPQERYMNKSICTAWYSPSHQGRPSYPLLDRV